MPAFHCQCLRRVLGIQHPYISRVSNAEVLRHSSQVSAADLLLKRQFKLLGRVIRAPEKHPLRACTFMAESNTPLTERFVRRVGRPCTEWLKEITKAAVLRLGSLHTVESLALDKGLWEATVNRAFSCMDDRVSVTPSPRVA